MTAKKLYITLLTALSILLLSCHTESPTADNNNTAVTISEVSTATEVLYTSSDTPPASIPVTEDSLYIKVQITDGNDLYKLSLIAEDSQEHEIKSISNPVSEEIFTVSNSDFAITQDTVATTQDFTLTIKLQTNSEEIFTSEISLSAEVDKFYPFDRVYKELGPVEEIEGAQVDFRDKNTKLAFIQFMEKGCLSCYEEAREMKLMYADTSNYDLSKYSHSLFGRSFNDETEFSDFKLRDEKLPFDCFFDNDNSFKGVFETITGQAIENEVFAVMPSGIIKNFDPQEYTDPDTGEILFYQWIDEIYHEADQKK